MSLKKLTLNKEGVKALLNSEEISAACVEVAQQVQSRAGNDYSIAPPHQTGQRVAVNIYPGTKEAAEDNYENNTLLRALGR